MEKAADRRSIQRPATPLLSSAAQKSERVRQKPQLGDLEHRLGYFVRRLQIWIFQDFIRTLSGLDIRPAQYSVLVVIDSNPGLSQADLAACLGIERARLVRLLDRLERRGLTERRAAPRDRRSHALYLTREGHRLLRRAKTLAERHETQVAEALGPARRKLLIDILRDFGR